MSLRTASVTLIFILLITLSAFALDNKKEAHLEKIGDAPLQSLNSLNLLSAADTCYARMDSGLVWRINGWVWGNELYKAYINPVLTCTDPYPFTVIAVNMPMIFDAATPLNVSVDIEEVDNTSYPGCHIPGNPLSISTEYNLSVPAGGGLFDIWIPLDTPVVVNGPFFAGFFISNVFDTSAHASVITDDSPPDSCECFNVWDLDVGLVDLNANPYYNFPGRLVLYAAGIPGGDSAVTQPDPAVVLLTPDPGDTLFNSVDIWAIDSSGSNLITHVTFAYSQGGIGGPYYELGRDYDGTSTFRDGVNNAVVGNGYNYIWNFSGMAEGQYTIRAASYDSKGGFSMDYRTVYLEPTPPIPKITSPVSGSDFCSPLNIIMTCADENISIVEIARKPGSLNYSAGLTTLWQNLLGDNNGNPNDGNHAGNGEYGDYYCGPAAAAIAAKVWYDRGYTSVLTDNSATIDLNTLAENLAAVFDTRANAGTYDDDLYLGLKTYFAVHGNELKFAGMKNPGYFDLRRWVEEEQRSVIVGLSGTPGLWLAVDGFSGWLQNDSSYLVKVSDPRTGTIATYAMREQAGYSEINTGGNWQTVDFMISILAKTWTVSRTMFGYDLDGSNGWSFSWVPYGITEDSLYFIRSSTKDATKITGYYTSLFRYNCLTNYEKGDYNNDDAVDIVDLMYLIEFIARGGPAPVGGAGRADANCDNYINITDIVYFMNYLFGSSDEPCY